MNTLDEIKQDLESIDSKLTIELNTIKQRMLEAGIDAAEVDKLIAPLAKNLNRRVCGLVWDYEHTKTKEFVDQLNGKLPALIRDEDMSITDGTRNNLLIEGDNLYALLGLQYTHIDENGEGTIGVIYIDPPYNTGTNEFSYTDKYETSDWLSMMNIRLRLAKNLLTNDGVIFISINDDYQAELKILCNDIFGNNNFLTEFVWEKTSHTGRQAKNVCSNVDYVMAYAKNDDDDDDDDDAIDYEKKDDVGYIMAYAKKKIDTSTNEIKRLLVDRVVTEFDTAPLFNESNNIKTLKFPAGTVWCKEKFNLKSSTNANYLLNTPLITKKSAEPLTMNNIEFKEFKYVNSKPLQMTFPSRWCQEELDRHIELGTKFIIKTSGCAIRAVYSENKKEAPIAPWQIIKTGKNATISKHNFKVGTNNEGSKLLKKLLCEKDAFTYPKPPSLIKYLLSLTADKNAIILDFFAGSGTTGQAVMELNAADDGNRTFICCTNNDVGKEKKTKLKKQGIVEGSVEYTQNGICRSVTQPRIKAVITGILPDGTKYSDGFADNNLIYYKIDPTLSECDTKEETVELVIDKFISYVCIKEDCFDIVKNDDYIALNNKIAIVTDYSKDIFDVQDMFENTDFSKVYCDTSETTIADGITYVPYPQEIIDTLCARRRDIIRNEVH